MPDSVEGKDNVFIPKGKVVGAVGGSGEFYDIQKEPSFDSWYIQNLRGLQLMAKKDGRTIEPGILKGSTPPMMVDPSEQKLRIIIYQDEYGNQFEIPILVPETNIDTYSESR